MLIITDKMPLTGTQKPKAWGNLSQVQSSVFRQAELLGIDPAKIKLFQVSIEGSGSTHNIINGDAFDGANYSWDEAKGLYTDSVQLGQVDCSFDITDFSCFTRFTSNENSSAERYALGNAYSGTIGIFQIGITANAPRLYIKDGSLTRNFIGGGASINPGDTVTLSANSTSAETNFYVDGAINQTLTNSLGQCTIPSITIGGRERDGYYDAPLVGWTDVSFIYAGYLSADILSQLDDSPYLLLTPTAPVFYSFASAVLTWSTEGSFTTESTGLTSSADSGSLVLEGSSTTNLRTLISQAASGEFVANGTDTSNFRTLISNAVNGSFVVEGKETVTAEHEVSTANAGSFVFSGLPTSNYRSLISSADSGSTISSGLPSSGYRTLLSNASNGSFVSDGLDATSIKLLAGLITSVADSGSFIIEGSTVSGLRMLLSSASTGELTIEGTTATGFKVTISTADVGSIITEGVNASGVRSLLSEALAGDFVINGVDVTALRVGASSAALPGSLVIQGLTAYSGGDSYDAWWYLTEGYAESLLGRQMQTNKAVISEDGLLVTIYADNGTTILHQFDVSSDHKTRTPV